MNKYAAWLMIICSAVLMQWHSIIFWQTWTANYYGGAFMSFGIEAAMLFMWYTQRHWFLRVAKYAAALLLIAGPWYQITTPAFESLQTVTVLHDKAVLIGADVATLERSLASDEENSNKRLGWRERIIETRAEIKAKRAAQYSLLDEKAALPPGWRPLMVAVMQALAFLIVLTAQLAAVTVLRNGNVTATVTKRNVTKRNSATERYDTPEQTEEFDVSVEAVAVEIRRRLPEFGSQAKMLNVFGLRAENIAAVLKHKERKETGGKIISSAGLEKIKKALGV